MLVILEIALIFLWAAAIGFSVVSLLVRGVKLLLRKETDDTKKRLGLWSTSAALLQLTSLVLLILIVNNAFWYAMGDTYLWMCAVLGVIAVVMCILSAYGLFCNNKGDKQFLKVRQRVFNNVTASFLLVTVINVLYWNLFMFWNV